MKIRYDFSKIEEEANKLAKEAAEKQLKLLQEAGPAYEILDGNERVVDRLLDLCGGSYIEFKDKRNSFYKQYKKYILENKQLPSWTDIDSFRYASSGCQEYSVNKAAAEAVYEYLTTNFDVNIKLKSYID